MSKKNQQVEAMSMLQTVQLLLGQLGFTLNGDGSYYKDYGLNDGSAVRVVPVFDRGISIDVSYKLVGFNLTSSRRVQFVDGLPAPMEEFPFETVDDIRSLVTGLAPSSSQQMSDTHMIMATCSQCGNEVESFLHIKNAYTCLKCLGMSDSE